MILFLTSPTALKSSFLATSPFLCELMAWEVSMSCAGKRIVQLGAKGGGKVQNDASSRPHLTTAASGTLGGGLGPMYPGALPSFNLKVL